MNSKVICLTLSKRGTGANLVTVAQGDSGGVTIEAEVLDGTLPADLSGMRAKMVMAGPDSNACEDDGCTVSGSSVTYTFDEPTLATATGTGTAWFELSDGNSTYSTERFRVKVIPGMLQS